MSIFTDIWSGIKGAGGAAGKVVSGTAVVFDNMGYILIGVAIYFGTDLLIRIAK